jgi:hypothetical protein
VLFGAAGVLRAADGTNGTVGIDDELTVFAGAPDAPALPLPHAATDAMVSATHAEIPMLTNDRADMFLTAWCSRARRREASVNGATAARPQSQFPSGGMRPHRAEGHQ